MNAGSLSSTKSASLLTRTARRCVQSGDAFGYPGVDQDFATGAAIMFHGKQEGRHSENDRRAWARRDDAGNRAHGATLQASVIGASRRPAVVRGLVAGRIRIMMLMMLMMTRALRMLRM